MRALPHRHLLDVRRPGALHTLPPRLKYSHRRRDVAYSVSVACPYSQFSARSYFLVGGPRYVGNFISIYIILNRLTFSLRKGYIFK